MSLFLGGCTSNGPINSPGFDNRFTGVISNAENIFLYTAAEVQIDNYMDDQIKLVDSYRGVMVLSSHAIRFLSWDVKEKAYRVQIDLPYRDLNQAKYGFNSLIPSYVAVRANNGEAFAFMIKDREVVKLAYRFLMLGKAGHLSVPE